MLYIVEYFSIFNLQKSGAKLRKYIHTYTILTLIIVIMPPVATQSDGPQRCLNLNRSLDFGRVLHLCLSDCFLPCLRHSWPRRGVAERKTADKSVQNGQRALIFFILRPNDWLGLKQRSWAIESPASRYSLGWNKGFEPLTFGTTIRRSNQLSYIHHVDTVPYRDANVIRFFGLSKKNGRKILSPPRRVTKCQPALLLCHPFSAKIGLAHLLLERGVRTRKTQTQ